MVVSTIQDLPTWEVALGAIAAAALFTWRVMHLMATKKQKLTVLKAVGVAVVIGGLFASIKHSSANHALMLLADSMVSFAVGTLPTGREVARVNRISADTGHQEQMSRRYATIFAFTAMGCGCFLLIVEYAVL